MAGSVEIQGISVFADQLLHQRLLSHRTDDRAPAFGNSNKVYGCSRQLPQMFCRVVQDSARNLVGYIWKIKDVSDATDWTVNAPDLQDVVTSVIEFNCKVAHTEDAKSEFFPASCARKNLHGRNIPRISQGVPDRYSAFEFSIVVSG
jgi:hypothetical protein